MRHNPLMGEVVIGRRVSIAAAKPLRTRWASSKDELPGQKLTLPARAAGVGRRPDLILPGDDAALSIQPPLTSITIAGAYGSHANSS